jgi:cell division initiation protein
MLTPQEITDKVFVKAVFGGYDMTGVDDFLESLSADYSALYKENAILKGKLKVLVEKVEEYRSTEDAMRMALLTAQRMGEEITVEANKQKEETLKSADKEATARVAQVAKLVADEEAKLKIASKETAKFIQLSQAIMQRHSDFLLKLETARRAVVPETNSAPPPPTSEEQIADVAKQIDSAVGKITSSDLPESAQHNDVAPAQSTNHEEDDFDDLLYDDDGDPTKVFQEQGESSISPRPRFDFDDLKFGANFENND